MLSSNQLITLLILKPWCNSRRCQRVYRRKYKGYNGLKGVKQTIEIKDGKVVQDLEVDFSVASISELRKALPEEYSGIGNRVSFSNSKKHWKNGIHRKDELISQNFI